MVIDHIGEMVRRHAVRLHENLIVNLVGFPGESNGEDRGFPIPTEYALLKKYSVNGAGDIYRLTAGNADATIAEAFIRLIDEASIEVTEFITPVTAFSAAS